MSPVFVQIYIEMQALWGEPERYQTVLAVGMGPGSMLLEKEYRFGMCLSLNQRTHSVDGGRSCSPGKLLKQVEHLGTSRK